MRAPSSPVCPICGKPSEKEQFPFCSPRCQRIDLGRWLGEAYRVPIADSDDLDEAENPEPERPDRG